MSTGSCIFAGQDSFSVVYISVVCMYIDFEDISFVYTFCNEILGPHSIPVEVGTVAVQEAGQNSSN